MVAWLAEVNAQLAATGKPPFQMKSIPQGAATSIWAGVVGSADEVGGQYCENCHVTKNLLVGDVDQVSEGSAPTHSIPFGPLHCGNEVRSWSASTSEFPAFSTTQRHTGWLLGIRQGNLSGLTTRSSGPLALFAFARHGRSPRR
jgi:hypothetical protein